MSKIESAVIAAATAAEQEAKDANNKLRRKKLFLALAGVLAVSAVGWGGYEHFHAANFVSTENAYTAAETAVVTPAIGGIVREVRVVDTDRVKQGDVLVVLDDIDARLALAQAEAELGRAVRRVRGYVANDHSLSAQIVAAGTDLDRARLELSRREALAAGGSVSAEEVTRARSAYESAQAARNVAIGAREANAVLIANATEDTNPEVALARAKRDQAKVNLERTVVRAPTDGVVVKRSVQVGQQVKEGSQLLSVVPVAQVHVDANFKEGQLDRVQFGQPVEVTSDLYGSKVVYHGKVAGLSGGSGSAFATIPAQNATGNWIKVVQRVPVRVNLDPAELAAKPLGVGLSMLVTIDTRK
jgi:membrane fusion protein (multidrug efflux system)